MYLFNFSCVQRKAEFFLTNKKQIKKLKRVKIPDVSFLPFASSFTLSKPLTFQRLYFVICKTIRHESLKILGYFNAATYKGGLCVEA